MGKLGRFFEEWWPVLLLVAFIVLVIGCFFINPHSFFSVFDKESNVRQEVRQDDRGAYHPIAPSPYEKRYGDPSEVVYLAMRAPYTCRLAVVRNNHGTGRVTYIWIRREDGLTPTSSQPQFRLEYPESLDRGLSGYGNASDVGTCLKTGIKDVDDIIGAYQHRIPFDDR